MLEITDTAREAIRQAIEGAGRPIAGLRVMVQGGGCAGFQYGMALELDRAEDDTVFENGEVTVLVDPESLQILNGVTIDFVTRLEGAGFVFNNPNAESTCGCGKSFC
ncbi:MAG: iron-sulfur cluster assembly accessory protein [Pseudomonadota bacterium]